jgi:membrane-associated protease RseP (regulator of RpoE activity)
METMRKKSNVLLFALALLAAGAAQLPAQVVVEGPARRGYLGFSFERGRAEGERALSLNVTDVVKESPAEKGGLRAGDVILRLNGLGASEALLNTISRSLTPGDTVTLRVRRGGGERELRLIAAQPPAGYFVARAMPGWVGSDSVRGLLRIFVDSMAAGLDTTRFRFFRDTTGGAQMFVFTDSAGAGDSVVVRRYMQQLPRGQAFDSVFARLPMDSILRRFPMDSAFRRFPFDSAFHGEVRVFPGEGDRVFEFSVAPPGAGLDNLTVFGVGGRAIAGARLEKLNAELGRYFRTERGVLVIEVPENTPARRAGLRAGDVITAADGTAVDDVGDVTRAFASARGKAVKLDVLRQGERRTLELAR